jgi:hypothetical protein
MKMLERLFATGISFSQLHFFDLAHGIPGHLAEKHLLWSFILLEALAMIEHLISGHGFAGGHIDDYCHIFTERLIEHPDGYHNLSRPAG